MTCIHEAGYATKGNEFEQRPFRVSRESPGEELALLHGTFEVFQVPPQSLHLLSAGLWGLWNMPSDTTRVPPMADPPVLSILPFSKGRSLLTSQHLASSGLFVGVHTACPPKWAAELLVGRVCPTCQAMLGSPGPGCSREGAVSGACHLGSPPESRSWEGDGLQPEPLGSHANLTSLSSCLKCILFDRSTASKWQVITQTKPLTLGNECCPREERSHIRIGDKYPTSPPLVLSPPRLEVRPEYTRTIPGLPVGGVEAVADGQTSSEQGRSCCMEAKKIKT